MTVTVRHASQTGAAANPDALVDGPKWDADHEVTGAAGVSGSATSGEVAYFASDGTEISGSAAVTIGSGIMSLPGHTNNLNIYPMLDPGNGIQLSYGTGAGNGEGGFVTFWTKNPGGSAPAIHQELGGIQAYAWVNGAYNVATSPVSVVLATTEAWTATQWGCGVGFQSIPIGTSTIALEACIADGMTILASGDPQNMTTGLGRGTLNARGGVYDGDNRVVSPSNKFLIGAQWFLGGTSNSPPTGPALTVSKNTAALPATGTPAGITGTAQAVMTLGGVDGSNADLIIQSFGASADIRYLTSGGTAASRTATVSGSSPGANFWYGYTGSVYVATAGINITATDNYDGSHSGSRLDLYATAAGGTSLGIAASFAAGVSLGTTTDPGSGALLATSSLKSSGATAGLGYATGAGGAVTQITSRTTGVALNKVCGAITLVSAAGSASYQTFTVTNSAVVATDVVRVVQKSGTDKYIIHVTAVGAGSFDITFATTGGTTTEQPVFNFAVIKAVAA